MVYYPISEADLIERIDDASATWRGLADGRTAANVAAGKLQVSDSLWSKIKPVYMKRQFDKCVYCEFPLGGRSTQDVEHFRPKSKISAWPNGKAAYPYATGAAQASGYYWLAYDPLNYAASCKDCNSALKRDAFPIMAGRGAALQKVTVLNASEEPLLLFPFGDWGDNPAEYFDYDGIFVQAKSGLNAAAERRAQVTIDFFRLNKRPNLLRARHMAMGLIWSNVHLRQTAGSLHVVEDAQRTILENIIDEAPQALCARAFLDLMEKDPGRAVRLRAEARAHLQRLGYLQLAAS